MNFSLSKQCDSIQSDEIFESIFFCLVSIFSLFICLLRLLVKWFCLWPITLANKVIVFLWLLLIFLSFIHEIPNILRYILVWVNLTQSPFYVLLVGKVEKLKTTFFTFLGALVSVISDTFVWYRFPCYLIEVHCYEIICKPKWCKVKRQLLLIYVEKIWAFQDQKDSSTKSYQTTHKT